PTDLTGAVDVLVTMWEESELRGAAITLAADLRTAGLRVEIYPDPDKIAKQFKYAADRRVRFVAVQGGVERAAATVTIKNLETGEQENIPRGRAAAILAERRTRT